MRAKRADQSRPGGVGKKLKDEPGRRDLFRLAIACGYPHPDLMLAQLDSIQLEEMRAFMDLELIGDERADFRSGLQTAAMLNGWGCRPKSKPTNFLVFNDKPALSDDQLMEKAKRVLGGK